MIFAIALAVSAALLGLTIDPNDLLGLLPPPWNLIVPLVLGFVLRHKGPALADRFPIVWKVLGMFDKPTTPAVPPPTDPSKPADPNAPLTPDHPVLKEILDRLRGLGHLNLGNSTRPFGNSPFTPLLFVLLMLSGSAFAGEALHDPVTSTVKVHCIDASGMPVAGGSGVVVGTSGSRSIVLTNRHVAECSSRHQVVAADKTYPAKLLGVDQAADLAGLAVDAALPAAPISEYTPQDGIPLWLYGFPAASLGRLCIKQGKADGHTWSSVDGRPWCYQFRTTFLSESGDSGGGVFDGSGVLVAINWGHDGKRSECVALSDLRRFVVQCGVSMPQEAASRAQILTLFTSSDCPHCPAAKRKCEALASKYGLTLQVVEADRQNPNDPAWVTLRKFDLYGVPASLILNSPWKAGGGQWAVHWCSGAPTDAEVRKAIAAK